MSTGIIRLACVHEAMGREVAERALEATVGKEQEHVLLLMQAEAGQSPAKQEIVSPSDEGGEGRANTGSAERSHERVMTDDDRTAPAGMAQEVLRAAGASARMWT